MQREIIKRKFHPALKNPWLVTTQHFRIIIICYFSFTTFFTQLILNSLCYIASVKCMSVKCVYVFVAARYNRTVKCRGIYYCNIYRSTYFFYIFPILLQVFFICVWYVFWAKFFLWFLCCYIVCVFVFAALLIKR